jgi:hypothetical protein
MHMHTWSCWYSNPICHEYVLQLWDVRVPQTASEGRRPKIFEVITTRANSTRQWTDSSESYPHFLQAGPFLDLKHCMGSLLPVFPRSGEKSDLFPRANWCTACQGIWQGKAAVACSDRLELCVIEIALSVGRG